LFLIKFLSFNSFFIKSAFKKQKADLKAELIKKELKLKNLLKNNASSKEISDQLTACAASKVSIGVAAYETANNMKNVLNETQKQKLNRRLERFHSMEQ
jgi:Spy/CpxP family protein refolding chaperone